MPPGDDTAYLRATVGDALARGVAAAAAAAPDDPVEFLAQWLLRCGKHAHQPAARTPRRTFLLD